MIIVIFLKTTGKSLNKINLLKKFAKNINVKNKKIIEYKGTNKINCDIGIIFGNINGIGKKANNRNKILSSNNCKWIVINVNPLNKKYYNMINKDYYFISFYDHNKLIVLNKLYRWKSLCKKNNIKVKPWRKKGDHILILLQSKKSFNTYHQNLYKWLNNKINNIRKYSKRHIIIRKKPKTYIDINKIKDPNNNFTISKNKFINDDLNNAWVSILFSTSACVSSIIEGIPVFCDHKSTLTYDISNKNISLIENPILYKRSVFFNKLASHIWTSNEFNDTWNFYYNNI